MTTYERIYKHQNESCFYCREKTELNTMEREHVFPRSKGGRGIKNKVLSCHFCNRLKSNLTINEFRIKVKELLVDSNITDNRLSNIMKTLDKLNNGQEIRKNWHKKASYKSSDINEKPICNK